MAKSKKKRSNKRISSNRPYNNGVHSNSTVKQTKSVYTEEYKAKKEYLNTEKPLLLRLLIIALACVVFLGFVILPLMKIM